MLRFDHRPGPECSEVRRPLPQIGCEKFSIGGKDAGGFHIRSVFQCGKRNRRGLRIIEQHSRYAIGANDLCLRRECANQTLTKGDLVVCEECGDREQQGMPLTSMFIQVIFFEIDLAVPFIGPSPRFDSCRSLSQPLSATRN